MAHSAHLPSGRGQRAVEAARALVEDEDRTAAARRLTPAGGRLANLDRVAGLAARLLRAGSAQVSLLADVQTVAGGSGLAEGTLGSTGPLEDSLCTVGASSGEPLVVSDARADDRVAGLPPVTSGAVGGYLGVPLRSAGGAVVGSLCVFDEHARTWDEVDVDLLRNLAEAVVSELELAALNEEFEASRALLELAVAAGGVGSFRLDVRTGDLTWDDQMFRLFGVDRKDIGAHLDDALARLHPEDRESVESDLATAQGSGELLTTYRVVLPDGGLRWLEARGRLLGGAEPQLIGTTHDVTTEREASDRISAALESLAVGYLAMDADWRVRYVNAEAQRLLGISPQALLGRALWELYPATVATEFEQHYRSVARTGVAVTFEAFYPAPLEKWFEIRVLREDGGVALYFLDVTARRQARDDAARTAERLALLASVTEELSGTTDAEEALERLAEIVIPALGDWCIVTLVEDDAPSRTAAGARASRSVDLRRGLRDVASWHRDPQMRAVVAEYSEHRLAELLDGASLLQALRQTGPVVVPESGRALRDVLAPGGRAAELLEFLAPASTVVLPLRAGGRTVGLLSLFSDREGLPREDLAIARDVAGRAGLALDAARAFRQQRDLAAGLQRSLLNNPVEPDHLQIVVRYEAAAEAAQIGGDWYDAFVQPGGATVLVIGDVLGHDTQAAAAMSQIRSTVRALGAVDSDPPREIVRRTDEVMRTLQISTTATALVARLEQEPSEIGPGLTRVRWSNAGHPPAAVVGADGDVQWLEAQEHDLLLGVAPDLPRRETQMSLERESTLFLFTDGLVERRDQPLSEGLARLREVLAEVARTTQDLDEFVDTVIARMLPPRPEDDAAVLAVRLHPQDAPRPPEAGPNVVPPGLPPDPAMQD